MLNIQRVYAYLEDNQAVDGWYGETDFDIV